MRSRDAVPRDAVSRDAGPRDAVRGGAGRGVVVGGVPVVALAVLYLLHNDVWFWDAPYRLAGLWGLPAGFVYHVVYCLAVSGLMIVLVRRIWPRRA